MSWPDYYSPFSTRYSFRRDLPDRDLLSRSDLVELIELLRQYPLPINRRVPRSRDNREVRAAQLLDVAIRTGLLTDEIPPDITSKGQQLAGLSSAELAALPELVKLQ